MTEYMPNVGVVVDIPSINESEFIEYVLNNSTRIVGDEFLYFEKDLFSLYEDGALEWVGKETLSKLLLVWGDMIESENTSIYKAWYINTNRVIDGHPLILYANKEYIYKLCGGKKNSNYNLKSIMIRLERDYGKKVKSVEIRCVDDKSIIRRVDNYDEGIPAIHKSDNRFISK